MPVDAERLGVDLLTAVGHKIYAPKGVAALYIRHGTPPLVSRNCAAAGRNAACAQLPGNLSLTIPHVTAEQLMAATPDLAFSAGAACHTGRTAPSPVLTAIGLSPDQAVRTIRLGVGRYTTDADITSAATRLIAAARQSARP